MRLPFAARQAPLPAALPATRLQLVRDAANLATPAERAEALLLAYLTPRQRETWQRDRYIEVKGSHGGWYCLHIDTQYHTGRRLGREWWTERIVVYQTNADGKHRGRMCSYVRGADVVPIEDRMLAAKLTLETRERRFRSHSLRDTDGTPPWPHGRPDPMLGWGG